MNENDFFSRQTISSRIKANIVSQYFPQYCRIINRKNEPEELRYIDLFAGPGIYEDGSPSTPILIARQCIRDEYLRGKVKFIFNDNQHYDLLEKNFIKEFPKGTFKNKPHFGKSTVGKSPEITKFLVQSTHVNNKNVRPSLLFIDPFGYKGIETKVLAEFLKNWGNEIFIFVNTKRIHPALENDKFEDLMTDLFPTTLAQLKNDRRYRSSVSQRLALIIDSLGQEYCKLLRDKIYYTSFKFQEEDSVGTSHYILHLTKGSRGFDLIKTIYNDFANVGTVFDGVNTYTFDAKKYGKEIVELFDQSSINTEILAKELVNRFDKRSLTAFQIYEEHHPSTLYSRSHYTKALRKLFEEGKIEAKFTDGKDHKVDVLLSKDCFIKFM